MLYRSLIALTVVAVGHAVPTRDLAHQSVHTLSVRKLADLNPAKTKDACKACVDGQSDVQTKEAAALAAADDNAAMLTKVNTQEEAAAKALKAEKAALVAYQAAQDDLAAAEDGLKKTQGAQKALQAAEDSAKSAAFEAKTALKTKCEGFDLGVINTDAPPPSPPPSPPPPPPPLPPPPAFSCVYHAGDGNGPHEQYLGDTPTEQGCTDMVRSANLGANGATYEIVGQGRCYAEFGMTGWAGGAGTWQSCIF